MKVSGGPGPRPEENDQSGNSGGKVSGGNLDDPPNPPPFYAAVFFTNTLFKALLKITTVFHKLTAGKKHGVFGGFWGLPPTFIPPVFFLSCDPVS